MNKIFLIIFAGFFMILSCEMEKNPTCIYDNLRISIGVDTTVFISYELNNVTYKYYQCALRGYSENYYADVDGKELWYKAIGVSFDILFSENTQKVRISSSSGIVFYYPFYKDNIESAYLLNFLKKNDSLPYVYPTITHDLSDTLLLKGVGISDYTEILVKTLDYDQSRIKEVLGEESFFKISKISPICELHSLIEGSFETKTIIDNDTLEIKNGQFKFVIPNGPEFL